jgi:hypothetical protein
VTPTASFTRFVALPVVSAGILGGAALGLAGMANAGTYSQPHEPRPGIVAAPNTFAEPPYNKTPKGEAKHGHLYIVNVPTDLSSAG